MTRRLLSVCVGAALVGMLSVPAHGTAKPPDLPEDGTCAATPVMSPPAPLFQLRPTARRTFAGSLLLGIHPALGLLPTDKLLDAPWDHPQPAIMFFFPNGPHQAIEFYSMCRHWSVEVQDPEWLKRLLSIFTARQLSSEQKENYIQAFEPRDFIFGLTPAGTITNDLNIPIIPRDEPMPMPREDQRSEQGEGRLQEWEPSRFISGLTPVDASSEEDERSSPPTIEILPMPHEDSDITCPYLRQQMIDKHACQLADPEIGRDVLANLESLKEADNLLGLAKELARDGFIAEAMMCCDLAAKQCPGSPCAQRAVDTMNELARGIVPPTTDTEESAEPQPDEPTGPCSQWDSFWQQMFESMGLPLKNTFSSQISPVSDRNFIEQYYKRPWDLDPNFDTFQFGQQHQNNWTWSAMSKPRAKVSKPGVEPMVCGLMKACHLLMNQGMQHQAAELARQAYALDPQRVAADPLIYKMHLLAESMTTPSNGASEESEPPTCPYCPSIGKPIREIVPEKKKKSEDGPATLLVPPLPPIDYEVVPALDGVLTESNGGEEASEESTPESMRELIETMLDGSLDSPLKIGTNADGCLRVIGDCSLGDNVYHLRYTHGCIAIWKTTDASKSKP
ncbi:MAG: hypothetical protein ACRELG_18535 [Gemmataceae bacterium]